MPASMTLETLTLAHHGAHLFRGAVGDALADLSATLACLPGDRAGVRIHGLPGLRSWLEPGGPIGNVAHSALGAEARPVRAILFDKSEGANWSLAWHQDRTICVRGRVAVDGFGPWSVKGGLHHVAPPFDLLARMVTLRVHLDDVPADNAPLLIAPGSHRHGRVPVHDIERVVARCGTVACLARAGDVWAYATPILHASEAALRPTRRRVLQVDYSADSLPGGLAWLGV